MRVLFRWLRRLLALAGSLVLLAIAAVAGLIWVTLPGGNGTAAIPSLGGPVEIAYDADGIPCIRAGSEADAAAALGYVHARDRMFQMELMRRNAGGELAELFGKAALPQDRWMRTLGLRERAGADLAALPAGTRALLEAYARGVNAWIAARGRLAAPEFVALGAPRPWTPVDSLLWGKTMALYLSDNWRMERARMILDTTRPAAAVDALWPAGSGEGRPQASLTPGPALLRTLRGLASVAPAFPAPFTLPDTASNGWAVDGRHSASGAPLLAGDPHLGFGFPSLWYLARIDWPGHVLAGATAPGVPFLVLGRNAHIAWTFTTTGADTQDLFIETPSSPGSYATPDGPKPFVVREERIRVRGRPDEVLRVRETRHGPLISDLIDPHGPMIALNAASLAPDDTASVGLHALNAAGSTEAAGAGAAMISAPVQNMIVADRNGIALYVTGRVPVRRSGDGARPVAGADGAHDWTGFASGTQLPHYVAPASGRLVNANDRIAPPDFPVFMGRDWYDDYRAQRIRQLLGEGSHTLADFAAMQTDRVDLAARDLLPALLAAKPATPLGRAALKLLNGWDGTASRETPQPLIFNAWIERLYAALVAANNVPPEAAAAVAPWPQFLTHAFSSDGAALCAGDCARFLAPTLDDAMRDLATRFGPDPSAWRWGEAHPAVFAHPVLRMIPAVGNLLEGRIADDGDDVTVDRAGLAPGGLAATHGPEFRGNYDLADLDRSLFVMAPGQSGNPFSQLARNFLDRWRNGDDVMLDARPRQVATTITLTPATPRPEATP
jgi:penicillin amidase